MKPSLYFLILFIIFFNLSCEKEDDRIYKASVSGYVQKGPFINGTSLDISELTSSMSQTGKTFSTQIIDNLGSFELNDLELSSEFVELKADGFYFNEVSGEKSAARLILYALSDLRDKNSLNVNILSHLEKSRIEYLISEGSSFQDAKKKAQSEILRIFSIQKPDMLESEELDITGQGDDNAILLAVSTIIQGFRTDAELAELLANISTDIRQDGILDNELTGTSLINHAMVMNLSRVRENLISRYEQMGMQVTIPDFEKYVQQFVESTDFTATSLIEYPENSDYGTNILYLDRNQFNAYTSYSMSAILPIGTELTVKLSGGLWFYRFAPSGPINWNITAYDFETQSQTFTALESGSYTDVSIEFDLDKDSNNAEIGDTITLEYFENGAELPTRTKFIYLTKFQ